jgi:Holliday junction DNA helicase RuvA
VPAAPAAPAVGAPRDQVVEALVGLGFPVKLAEQAVDAILAESGTGNGTRDASAVLRAALTRLGRPR